ncbi:MAG TPA: carboxypeptidase-like regulatory domain-containing protein [Candidatus Angelobacter sp.]|nr:carboxypeptidase-like regulatory domain-containing protein [Candidatus Angelobacter sp.]
MIRLRSASFILVIASVFGAFCLFQSSAAAQRGKNAPRERSLAGHVFDKDNQPVSRAVVYLKNTRTKVAGTYITEQDGSYRFPWLASDVDYELHAEFHGARSDTKIISSFDTRKQFDIVLRLH